MPLKVTLGRCSLLGKRELNEDFSGFALPRDPELSKKGILLAIADGISGGGGGQASTAVGRGLLNDYYATPETWEAPVAIDHIVNAANRWIVAHRKKRPELDGMATTLTAAVLRGKSYCIAHIGDTRAYLLRNARLERLTTDHVWDRPGLQHVLTRAIGLDTHVAVDYSEGELETGDVLLLATDGVWAPLRDARMRDLLLAHDPQAAADALCAEAIAAGSTDNATVLVARIDELPDGGADDIYRALRDLPLPPKLAPGAEIEGFQVVAPIAASRETLVYRVRNAAGQNYVLKTLQSFCDDDREARAAFAREEWLAQTIDARPFPRYVPLPADSRNFLYYVTTWHEGTTLEQQLNAHHHFNVQDVVLIGMCVARGLGILHRRGVLHRDIKPANLHMGDDGELRILDLGIAKAGSDAATSAEGAAGTPTYIAPELYSGASASPQSDLFAAGITLYHLLTRKYPYGEIEPFQRPRFRDPVPPTRYRSDIPTWFENAILKAVARDRKSRFETAEEMLLAFERGASAPITAPPRLPMAARDPAAFWRGVATIALVVNLLLLYVLLLR
jgi:protein phosphatase